mgnify:CR=1 FL=1
MMQRRLTPLDKFIERADSVLRTLSDSSNQAMRPSPAQDTEDTELDTGQRQHVAGLMRVNHTGEVCAQALYTGQALACQSPALRAQLAEASREETDHLAWTQQRLTELKDRPSLLNPLWYAGAFVIGLAAGRHCHDGHDELLRAKGVHAIAHSFADVEKILFG